jgi:DNA modification methylase
MKNYRTIQIQNKYDDGNLALALPVLNHAGIETIIDDDNIQLNFDIVDIKYIESKEANINGLVTDTLCELKKIRSFSSAGGKLVYASFNKDKRTTDKDTNKQKRLGYEYLKKDFPEATNTLDEHLINKIHCANSLEFLKQLPDNCIDIVVTSPPYNFGISYNSTGDANPWSDYFNFIYEIFRECIRVLKSGGRFVLNIQPLYSDYIPSHHIISNFFINEGMVWKGEIIWEKNNYNCKYCTWGSWQSPSSPYLKYSWEFIEIFCKNTLKKDGSKENIDIDGEEFKKWVYGKWSIAPERNMKKYKHDAMFPEELIKRILKLFSFKNDIVLDPFNGAGTTTKVALENGRRFIGIDIDEKYCETARNRLVHGINLFNYSEVKDDDSE